MRIEWTTSGGVLEAIDFDATPRESYEGAAEVTEHAVERGASVSDHVRVQGGRVSLEAMVSNHPIDTPKFGMDGVTGGIGAGAGGSTFQWSGAFDRVARVDAALAALVAAGQVVRVVTGLRTIDDLVLERYKVEREAATGNSLPVTLDLRQVRIASSERVEVPDPAQRRGRRSQNRGVVPAVPTDNRSFLARGDDDAGGPVGAFARLLSGRSQ